MSAERVLTEAATTAIGVALPSLVSWATKRLTDGGDEASDRALLFDLANAVADEAMRRKLEG